MKKNHSLRSNISFPKIEIEALYDFERHLYQNKLLFRIQVYDRFSVKDFSLEVEILLTS